ncbi:hypothetical protein E4V51_31820, partial [Paenibacillus sp. 28ISP30-2]|nr:hypothetical protein [Paenibacillus sp. 28ISP30-2]
MAGKHALNIVKMKKMKQEGIPLSMLTAYDYPSAKIAEEAGIDMILVGDSLGNVVLGYDSTIPVTLDDIVYHSRAVARGAEHTFIVADMPFMTYHGRLSERDRKATLWTPSYVSDRVRRLVRGKKTNIELEWYSVHLRDSY